MKTAKILITAPMKIDDPTEWTHSWAIAAKDMALDLGYDVKIIEGEDTTYDNVTQALLTFKPNVYLHVGHGCKLSLQGNSGCIVARNFSVDHMIAMAESPDPEERLKLLSWVNPLGTLACPDTSYNFRMNLEADPCSKYCTSDTNVNLLKDTITYAIACHSGDQLARCMVKFGGKAYVGYDQVLMFPVDTKGSQNIFGQVQLVLFQELLLGKSIKDADLEMRKVANDLIRKNKGIKYIAVPMLWNEVHRKISGNENATIY